MSKVEHIAEGVSLYLGDCREILPGLGKVDAVVTDPPYGIGFVHSGKGGKLARSTQFGGVAIKGDNEPFDPTPWLAYPRVILFGANHFADRLPPSPSWLVWDKRDGVCSNDQADCEMAWTNLGGPAAADIKVLKAAVGYWHDEYGPLNFIPSFWRPEENPPKDRWLTRSEAARLLWAARRTLHLRRAILLGLYTGSRPGVILALRWDQVDLRSGVMSRTPEGEVQDKRKRAPKVRLGRRIIAHLKRWRRIDNGETFVCHFEGRAVKDPHDTWRRAVKAAKLKGVTRHTLRHTRATWMMQAGVPIWEAAGFLGMTVKTLERVYGHHSPDHQERAANI